LQKASFLVLQARSSAAAHIDPGKRSWANVMDARSEWLVLLVSVILQAHSCQ
jgi:hypothetical protein